LPQNLADHSRLAGTNPGAFLTSKRSILTLDCIQFEMKTPPSKYCTTSTLRIEYLEYGDPHGQPLILLHGFPDAPVAWSGVIAGLRTKGLRILVPCLRGYGKTEVLLQDLIGGQEAALGMDLLEFADALELETSHLAGHDWGARTSYAACVFAPYRIKSLLALATPYVLDGGGNTLQMRCGPTSISGSFNLSKDAR
jgi:pimeloyl-ACP methyl ester carboxylesterase